MQKIASRNHALSQLQNQKHFNFWEMWGYSIADVVIMDQLRFLRNCPPTPPLTQHFALSEKC